jgi:putative membrane protein
MNPQSALERQFPLSQKKFFKKMFSYCVSSGVFSIFAGIIVSVIYFAITNNNYGNTANVPNIPVMIGLFLTVAVVCFFVFTIPYGFYVKAYIRRYYYSGEDKYITIKKGVFAPAEIHVQYQKIQDVYVDQDVLDRILGLYDVHIASATAASAIEAHIDGVEKTAAEGLKAFFLNKLTNGNQTTNGGQDTQQNPTTPVAVAATAAPQLNISEEISSEKYPLSLVWIKLSMLGRLLGGFTFSAFIFFYIFVKAIGGKNASVNTIDWSWFIFGWIGVALVIGIAHVITFLLWKRNYQFKFGPDNIYFKEGVISLSEKHMPYSSIQDVTVVQGVFERFFGLAKVRIENAATQTIQTKNGRMAVFTGVILQGLTLTDANKITDILKKNVLGKNTAQYGL